MSYVKHIAPDNRPAPSFLALGLASIAVVASLACASFGARAKFALTSCAEPAVVQGADALSGAVAGILTGGADYQAQESQLLALGEKLGLGAVVCAVQAFVKGPPPAPDLAAPIKAMAASPTASNAAKKFLAAHAE